MGFNPNLVPYGYLHAEVYVNLVICRGIYIEASALNPSWAAASAEIQGDDIFLLIVGLQSGRNVD